MDEIDPPHGSDLGRVVDEADVSLGSSVQLSDFNLPEAIQKLRPNISAGSVTDGDLHSVVPLIVFLQKVRFESNRDIKSFIISIKLIL